MYLKKTVGLVRRFHLDEEGAAYTITYVMTLPIYMIMVMAFIELSMALSVKVGTSYAAFGAARTAAVWDSIDHSLAQEKSRQSASQAMAPFAGGLAGNALGNSGTDSKEQAFMDFYRSNKGSTQASEKYVLGKYRYAVNATRVRIANRSTGKEPWEEDVVVTVEYDYPFLFPFFGRLMNGTKRNGVYSRTIATSVSLQNEAPANQQKRLGIRYD